MSWYLIIPHIHIENANAMNSLYTIGFPSMTSWLGGVHALQRRINERQGLSQIEFVQTAVICHHYRLHTYKNHSSYSTIISTSNPLKKNGKRPSFIEEGRMHLDVSLVVEVSGVTNDSKEELEEAVAYMMPTITLAGGNIIRFGLELHRHGGGERRRIQSLLLYGKEDVWQQIKRLLMPGYVILDRHDVLMDACKDKMATDMPDDASSLDTLLACLAVTAEAEKDDMGHVQRWNQKKALPGWLIPIMVGFKGVTSLEHVKNQRDPTTLHRFVEPAITLAEFKMLHHIYDMDAIFWHYAYDDSNSFYVCRNTSRVEGE